MTNPSLTDREYWVNSYRTAELVEYEPDNDHFRLLFRYVDPSALTSVIEIGSYPAPFLAALGRYGCELNGIDFHPDNSTAVPAWLVSRGYKVGSFVSDDFLHYRESRRFDLAYSLGFIEHFSNYGEIVRKQARLVKPGGFVFISTPNFRGGIQRWLHRVLDKANMDRHYIPSMQPEKWAATLRDEGFDVLFAGHYGHIGFWVDPISERSKLNRAVSRAVVRLFWNVRKVLKKDSSLYSVFCGVVAVRSIP